METDEPSESSGDDSSDIEVYDGADAGTMPQRKPLQRQTRKKHNDHVDGNLNTLPC